MTLDNTLYSTATAACAGGSPVAQLVESTVTGTSKATINNSRVMNFFIISPYLYNKNWGFGVSTHR
jgi:hypothetical protein